VPRWSSGVLGALCAILRAYSAGSGYDGMHYQELYGSSGSALLSAPLVPAVGPANRRGLPRGVEDRDRRGRAAWARSGNPERVGTGSPDDIDGAATGEDHRRRVRVRRCAEALWTHE